MPISFNVLLNAALGGAAAYGGGKRTGQLQKAAALRQMEIDRQAKELHDSQIAENRAQAAERQDRIDHPEKYRNLEGRATPAHEAFRSTVEEFQAKGMSLKDASAQARLLYGRNEDDPPRPVYDPIEVHKATRSYDIAHPLPTRDSGEDGSHKADIDRREFFQSRVAKHVDAGLSPQQAQAKANEEWLVSEHAANFAGTSIQSSTARTLARTIPTSSANAGKRGVKPTETSSTPRRDPTDKNSPKINAVRKATDADLLKAAEEVGWDARKVEKWLHDHNLEQ